MLQHKQGVNIWAYLIHGIKRSYLWVFCFLGITIYLLQYFEVGLPNFLNNHLNDLLCMPIVLGIAQRTVRFLKSDSNLTLPVALQVVVTLLFALYFEWYLPQFNLRYTADVVDVLCYFLGMAFFEVTNRLPN